MTLTDPAGHDSPISMRRRYCQIHYGAGYLSGSGSAGFTSRILDPLILGEEHYNVARGVQQVLQKYKDLQDIIAILGMDELSEEDKEIVASQKDSEIPSQPFSVAEQFTGMKGKYVPIEETVRGFREILEGRHDHIPESMFLFAGSIDDVVEKYEQSKEQEA